jgi:hypothetical protein
MLREVGSLKVGRHPSISQIRYESSHLLSPQIVGDGIGFSIKNKGEVRKIFHCLAPTSDVVKSVVLQILHSWQSLLPDAATAVLKGST